MKFRTMENMQCYTITSLTNDPDKYHGKETQQWEDVGQQIWLSILSRMRDGPFCSCLSTVVPVLGKCAYVQSGDSSRDKSYART